MFDTVVKTFVFIFGAIIGSFLNVCIYRMPKSQSVVWPGSHCPLCEKRIPWYDNIPFLSYIMLSGKCRFCRKRISPLYLMVARAMAEVRKLGKVLGPPARSRTQIFTRGSTATNMLLTMAP